MTLVNEHYFHLAGKRYVTLIARIKILNQFKSRFHIN